MLSLSRIGSEERKSRLVYAGNMFQPMEEAVKVSSVRGSTEF